MSTTIFKISAFGDEIAADLQTQLDTLNELGVGFLELRAVGGTNVLHLDDEQVRAVERACAEAGVAVSCIGSPVGKSPLLAPPEDERANLLRLIEIADVLHTRLIRVFSFYPPDATTNELYDEYVSQAVERLVDLSHLAEQEGVVLVLENEKAIIGDTPERCWRILRGVDSPALRFAWDPANFIQVGVDVPISAGWHLLAPYVEHVHVKDAVSGSGQVCPAGEGDGQVPELLTALSRDDYRGFIALEPHLAVAGHSSGFSGVEGMTRAVVALRDVLSSLGYEEDR
ncbi:MAG: sugar phosphate isomerase/epimerase [Chloroflexi bacterium]|nr:sugar phosphate isomerase/epimerase [Chloroflexota bacterium]